MAIPAQEARERKNVLVVDPLMLLSEAQPLLGNPSYSVLRGWIAAGKLKVWRVGRSHFRIRLSEVERFLSSGDIENVKK